MTRTKRLIVLACTASGALIAVASASAHARVSPAVSLASEQQLYSLAVPTEKESADTTKVVLTVPQGFLIDSFAPSPGWTRATKATGSGEEAVVTEVTWSGGHTPAEEVSLFQFLAQATKPGTYTFHVEQTYSDGSIVEWSGSESSDMPAPTIDVVSSVDGSGGTSTLTIVALILGGLGLLVGGIALFSRGGRSLT